MQIRLMRQASARRKLEMVAQMNHAVRTLMWRSLKQRHPQTPPESLRRMLAELLLGQELAQKVYEHDA
jgi:hypothetical protein